MSLNSSRPGILPCQSIEALIAAGAITSDTPFDADQVQPASLDLRLATRPAHIAYLTTYASHVVQGGPLLDADGRPCGSMLLVDVADRAAAEGFAASDPYGRAGLFESTVIRAFRTVFKDGEAVG